MKIKRQKIQFSLVNFEGNKSQNVALITRQHDGETYVIEYWTGQKIKTTTLPHGIKHLGGQLGKAIVE